MAETLIKWRLNEVMARHRITGKALAAEMNLAMNSVSNLRGPEMPRLTKGTLNSLLNALNKLSQDEEFISVSDIIEYSRDADDD